MTWIAAVSNGLKFANALMGLIQSHRDFGAGWDSAIAQALTTAAVQAEAAKQEIDSASERHAHDDTDGAFDRSFERKD